MTGATTLVHLIINQSGNEKLYVTARFSWKWKEWRGKF